MIGDEDTVTGFLLGGIGELNKNRHPNFLVVEKDTTVNEIEDTFRYGGQRGLKGNLCCPGGGRGRRRGASRPRPKLRPEGQRDRSADPSEWRPPLPKFPLAGGGVAMSGSRAPPHMTVCQERRGTELVTDAAPRSHLPRRGGASRAQLLCRPGGFTPRAGCGHCSARLVGELTPKGTAPPVNTQAASGSGLLVFSAPCKVEGMMPP